MSGDLHPLQAIGGSVSRRESGRRGPERDGATARSPNECVEGDTLDGDVGAIDRSSSVPLYYQLALLLWERLASGRLEPGDQLPSEGELTAQLGISRSVIRPALTILEREGRIVRIKGRGCFVAQPKVPLEVRGIVPRLAAGTDPDLTISILDARTVRITEEMGSQLELRAGQPVVHVMSAGSSRDRPLFICDSYVTPAALPGIARLTARRHVLSDVVSVGIDWTQPRTMVESGVCAQFEAEHLGVPPGSPTMVARVVEHGLLPAESRVRPIELAWLAFRMDSVRLSFGPPANRHD